MFLGLSKLTRRGMSRLLRQPGCKVTTPELIYIPGLFSAWWILQGTGESTCTTQKTPSPHQALLISFYLFFICLLPLILHVFFIITIPSWFHHMFPLAVHWCPKASMSILPEMFHFLDYNCLLVHHFFLLILFYSSSCQRSSLLSPSCPKTLNSHSQVCLWLELV